jgi:hypothetical protein
MLLMVSQNAAADAPDRTIQGHVVVSTHDPAVQVRVPASSAYVGADRWLLKEYADDIELHCFVNADPDRRVRQIYWVQFEAYLPSRPELRHHYTSSRHATLGGLDFYLDTWVASTDSSEGPDSDGAHLNTLLHSAGYRLPASMMTVRLVHLTADSRKELMLIYGEDLAATGFTAADLGEGGKAHARWPAIEARLINRAERAISIQPLAR